MNPVLAETTHSFVFWYLGQAVLQGTLLALGAWAILALLRKRITPTVHVLFWLVVLVKFIVPVGPGSSWSLASLLQRAGDAIHAPNSTPPTEVAGESPDVVLVKIVPDGAPAPLAAAVQPMEVPWPIGRILAGVYLACMVGIGVWRYSTYARFARQCRRLPLADASLTAVVERVCRIHGVARAPETRVSADATAPFIVGGLRPLLVLSPRQCGDVNELEAVVLHEIAHLRRRDLLVRYVQWFAGTLLFFWPVVAWVNRRIDLAREQACDDWALRHGQLSAGDYARCLLRALHRDTSVRLAYRPASMARNVWSVERRIEMILESPRTRTKGSLGIPVVLALAGWTVFALAGAKAAEDAPKTVTVTTDKKADDGKTETKTVVTKEAQVIVVNGDGDDANGPMDVKVEKNDKGEMEVKINGKVMHTIKEGDGINMLKAHHLAGGGMMKIGMMEGFVSEKDLEQFAKDHPTADANADGKVSRTERQAFLAALAMTDSAATLAQYPKADLNKNGVLDANEAARLATDGAMECDELDNGNNAWVAGAPADGKKMHVMMMRKAVWVNGPGAIVASKPGNTTEDGKAEAGKAEPETFEVFSGDVGGSGAAKWLLDNVKGTPAAADVARLMPTVEEAPMVRFAEMFPEADTNKDGKVSREERKAHLDKQMSDVRARMLKRHPEADTDGDGKLSTEEEQAFFHKRAMKTAIKTIDGQPDADGNILIETVDDGDEKETRVEVRIQKDGSADVTTTDKPADK